MITAATTDNKFLSINEAIATNTISTITNMANITATVLVTTASRVVAPKAIPIPATNDNPKNIPNRTILLSLIFLHCLLYPFVVNLCYLNNLAALFDWFKCHIKGCFGNGNYYRTNIIRNSRWIIFH